MNLEKARDAGLCPMRTARTVMVALLCAATLPTLARPAPDAARRRAEPMPAAGMMLVARRDMPSHYFRNSVILLLRHETQGTLGVIINRRTRFRLHELLPEVSGTHGAGHPVLIGGPVATQALLMLIRKPPVGGQGIEAVTGEIAYSVERAVLESLLAGKKPVGELRFYVGHAGWAPGQLDGELARGDWHLMQADTETVFGDDEERMWKRLIDRLDPPGIRVGRPGLVVAGPVNRPRVVTRLLQGQDVSGEKRV